jgi:glutamyl-tRNA synthetase
MGEGARERLEAVRDALASLDSFDQESIESALRGLVDRFGVKPKEVFQPLRVAIAGSTISPGIFESVVALGREETLGRVDDALARPASPA